jgi:hydrogenase nickel incorporation protein HypA/HybF
MHELAIADAIVRIVEDHAAGRRVTKVDLTVGHLRQVVPSALEFSFELVAAGTVADGAALAITHVPVEARCRGCGETTPQEGFPLACNACGALDVDVVAGDELYVEAVELEEDEDRAEELIGAGKGR